MVLGVVGGFRSFHVLVTTFEYLCIRRLYLLTVHETVCLHTS